MTALVRAHAGAVERPPSRLRVPALIKRNTALFALSQSFTGAGMQLSYGIGPLMVIAVTGSAGLAGLSVAVIGLSRFLVSYPVGKITDRYGRKPGILLGLVLALIGTILVGRSMSWQSAAALIGGMLVFGMGMNAAQQLRVAATDMFPPQLRAQALGYVALGSLVGLVISPLMITAAEEIAPGIGEHPLGLPWLLLPVLIVAGMVLVAYVRPDPKDIGLRLEQYYPGYAAPARPPGIPAQAFSAIDLLRAGADASRHRFQLRRPGQHVDRDGVDFVGARPSRALAHPPSPSRTCFIRSACSPSPSRSASSPTGSGATR